jgi:hypothetical protein
LHEQYLTDNPGGDQKIDQENVQIFDTTHDDSQLEHHKNFYRSIREGKPLIEDAVFGLRAAGPALLTNASLFERKIVYWDPKEMKRVEKPS